MEEINWRELVEATRKGDKQAFEKLYRGTERAVYFTCLKLLANEDSAKDIMQDTFMTALNKLDSLDDGAKFPMWINRIAVNKCKDSFKKVANDSIDEQMEQGADFKDDDKFIPEEYVTDETKRQIILRIINEELSEVQRQTIILYYYDEMPLEEISEVMDCPVKTVSSRLCSARDKIKGAVLIYERENDDRLHALVPVPILTKILRMEAQSILVPDISQILLQANIFGAATASASSITTSTIAGGSTTMSGLLTGKAAIAIAAGVIGIGGITTALVINKNKDKEPSSSISITAKETEEVTQSIPLEDHSMVQTTVPHNDDSAFQAASLAVENGLDKEETSIKSFEPVYEELDPEIAAKIEEAWASGAKMNEIKFGTKMPVKYIDPTSGKEGELRYHGIFKYFPLYDPAEDEAVKAEIMDVTTVEYYNMSGNIPLDQIPSYNNYVCDRAKVVLGNGSTKRLIYSVEILGISFTDKDTGETRELKMNTDPETETNNEGTADLEKYKDLFFDADYMQKDNEPSFMLPKGANTDKYTWDERIDGDVNVSYKFAFSAIDSREKPEDQDDLSFIKSNVLEPSNFSNIIISSPNTQTLENIEIISEEPITVLDGKEQAVRLTGYATISHVDPKLETIYEKQYFECFLGEYKNEYENGDIKYYVGASWSKIESDENKEKVKTLIDVSSELLTYDKKHREN